MTERRERETCDEIYHSFVRKLIAPQEVVSYAKWYGQKDCTFLAALSVSDDYNLGILASLSPSL